MRSVGGLIRMCGLSGRQYSGASCKPGSVGAKPRFSGSWRCAGALASAPAQSRPITSSLFNSEEKMVSVHWGQSPAGTVASFPAIFLRDNCTCPECLHSTGIRTREMMMWESDVVDSMTEIKEVKVRPTL